MCYTGDVDGGDHQRFVRAVVQAGRLPPNGLPPFVFVGCG